MKECQMSLSKKLGDGTKGMSSIRYIIIITALHLQVLSASKKVTKEDYNNIGAVVMVYNPLQHRGMGYRFVPLAN